MNDTRMEWALFAIPAVGLLIVGVRFGGGFTGFAALGRAAVFLAALAVVAALVLLARAVGGGRSTAGAVAHVHGGQRAEIARHEAGHVAAARAVGGRVTSARVYGDRGGLVQARLPEGPLPAVTFLIAGQIAVGTTRGADADNHAIRRELRGLPRSEASAIRRAATRDARRIVSRHASAIDRDTATLTGKGRL